MNYLSCLSVPYRKFKEKLITNFITYEGITYYPFSELDLDFSKMKLKKKATLLNSNDETQSIVLWV